MRLVCCGVILAMGLLLVVSGATNRTPVVNDSRQERVTHVVNNETYNQVLDLVFPRDVLEEGGARYAFVLRYEPSFSAESQITIVERLGKVEIIQYDSADGNIDTKLNNILRDTGQADATKMAQRIKIRRRMLNLSPTAITRLRNSFFDALRLSLQTEKKHSEALDDVITVTSDGTKYRLWYKGDGNIHYILSGSDVSVANRADDSPLMGWMKNVYRMVK